ncbi:MAG: hypothetical protein NWE78_01880, partial [Candidatus Bathyarchaeota archaeon]|nr:hypothetical protein [Candidatus Bathyarchaeota archaeon]
MIRLFSHPVVEERILSLVEEKADSKIFAACFYGPMVLHSSHREPDMKALIVIQNYQRKISSFTNQEMDLNLFLLAIDKKMFESDVEKGKLGDLISDSLSLPYLPWINPAYFRNMEVKMKKRSISELIKNLIFQYPELSDLLLIRPEYFMYETMRRKGKLFPPLKYDFARTFTPKVRKQNFAFIMSGYLEALKELETENCVSFSNGYVRIVKNFAKATIQQRNLVSSMLASIHRALLPYIQSLSLRVRTGYVQNQKTRTKRSKAEKDLFKELEETEKHILMPSPLGPIPISNKTTIQEFIKKTVPGADELDLKIKEMGGVLNSVFMLRIRKDNETQRIVVKRFENWQGFKWFPLALWALGTQSFAVSGKKRLEREYSNNQFLKNHGFAVPTILYVSIKERLIFEEFVEGEKLTKVIKRIIASKESTARDLGIIRRIGKEIAKVHSLGVTLGDCKPENILVKEDDDICFLDLEQSSSRNGNQSWDIAEFLYYSGHYIPPIRSDEAAKLIATSFLEGYIEGKGRREVVRKSASAKYTKIFSVFTLPNIILLIAGICKKFG